MKKSPKQNINIRLSPENLRFTNQHLDKHTLLTRIKVVEARKPLQEREWAESLAAGYRAMGEDYIRDLDLFMDSDLEETLEAIDQG